MAFRNYKLDIDPDLFDRQRETLNGIIALEVKFLPHLANEGMIERLQGIQDLCDEIADQIADTTQQEGE